MFFTLFLDAILSYTDVYFILFLLLVIHCYQRERVSLGTVFFAISCLVKWQPIILAPLILLYVVRRRPTIEGVARLLPAILCWVAHLCPLFLSCDAGIYSWRHKSAAERERAEPELVNHRSHGVELSFSGRPGNDYLQNRRIFFTKLGQPVSADVVYSYLLYLSSALRYFCYAVSLCYFYCSDRTATDFVRASIICFLSYFAFGFGAHENHAYVRAICGVCCVCYRSRIDT